jgi:acyl transferase domain-containing protein
MHLVSQLSSEFEYSLNPLQSQSLQMDPIAIVGFDLHFPGDASSTEAFWDLLVNRRSARSEVPEDRFNIESFYHPDQTRPGTVGKEA